MNILIIDDYTIFSGGLKLLIVQLFPNTNVEIKRFSSLRDFLSSEWDIIILDIDMQEKNSIDILKYIHKESPEQAILMLGTQSEEHYAFRALKAGAKGYIPKDALPADLERAISLILGGFKYVSATLAQLLADNLKSEEASDKAPHETLSDREFTVFLHIASGITVSKIAEIMLISVKTVSTYRTRILTKTNLKTNADITQYAVKYKLIDLKAVSV